MTVPGHDSARARERGDEDVTSGPSAPSLPRARLRWPDGPRRLRRHQPRVARDQRPRRLCLGHGRAVRTRRYHGLFIPALPEKHGRTVLLARLGSRCGGADGRTGLDAEERADGTQVHEGAALLRALPPGRPGARTGSTRWSEVALETQLVLVHGENTVIVAVGEHVGAGVSAAAAPRSPSCAHDDQLHHDDARAHGAHAKGSRVELRPADHAPPLRMRMLLGLRVAFVG